MQRRRFIQVAAMAGGLAAAGTAAVAAERRTVILEVQGFSCPTCAIGLDTLLMRQKGVVSSHSTYPDGQVTVSYQPARIAEDAICGCVAEMGFSIKSKKAV